MQEIPKTDTGLYCSNDGFVDLVQKLNENVFILISLAKEWIASLLPKELNKMVQYIWDGFMGLGNWGGYLLGAFYYSLKDLTLDWYFCEFMGYGYYVVDGLNYITKFARLELEK